ncbi:MAG TPA: hypothetical protein PLP17_09250 [Oligoflexia bacterium]|nr:hypothetical protein [Oligoflexia bacterium]
MGPKGLIRAREADERRRLRAAQRQQRELERRRKEQSKLSAIEQARLEVETYENRLELLLSVHKEQGPPWDWSALAAALPPPCPQKISYYESRAKQRAFVLPPEQQLSAEAMIQQSQAEDERLFQEALRTHAEETAEWEKLRNFARRILAGDHKAFIDALSEFSPLAELSDVGSLIHFTVETTKLIRCELKVNGTQAIPTEIKTLTASGKISVKPMPKTRFHEIYQDYVCGSMLRVTREVFAILPVDAVLITASADILDTRTGHTLEQPVLSAVMPRAIIASLDFDKLDPSDAMENFLHRGDFKASRKVGAFLPITPLTPADIPQPPIEEMGYADLLVCVRRLREELQAKLAALKAATVPEPEPSSNE